MTPIELKRVNVQRLQKMIDKETDEARREVLKAALAREKATPLDAYTYRPIGEV